MFLMFAHQFASQITSLIFVLINDFCDFDHCYFPDYGGEGGAGGDTTIYLLPEK